MEAPRQGKVSPTPSLPLAHAKMSFPKDRILSKRPVSDIKDPLKYKTEKRKKTEIKKGTWSEEEDSLLVSLIGKYPSCRWSEIAAMVPGRSAKQCRERWSCNLDPSINRAPWTPQEDRMILNLQVRLGNRWAQIAGCLRGRTENAVKTRFKSIIRAQKREWSEEEDSLILSLQRDNGSNWCLIAKYLPNRTKNAVKTRYRLLAKGKGSPCPDLGAPNQILFEERLKKEFDSVSSSSLQSHTDNRRSSHPHTVPDSDIQPSTIPAEKFQNAGDLHFPEYDIQRDLQMNTGHYHAMSLKREVSWGYDEVDFPVSSYNYHPIHMQNCADPFAYPIWEQ